MKKIAVIIALTICTSISAGAQTFLDRLQRSGGNQGTITVTQSEDIDRLVNGNSSRLDTPPTQTQESDKATATNSKAEERPNSDLLAENDIPITESRKKVMRNSYRTDGYRVQVFAGGNTRKDRQRAERIGNEIKSNFPDEPIYVHFYSPRWICRVGNYKSYEEAHSMLMEVRKLGYKQAVVVKGKITLQY